MRRVLNSAIAIWTLASLFLAVGLALTTDVEFRISVLLALLIAMSGLGIRGFLILRDQIADVERARVAALPLAQLDRVPGLEKPLNEIVSAVVRTQATRGAVLGALAMELVASFSDQIERLARGSTLCRSPEEELRLVEMALSATSGTVKAVASRGLSWWSHPESDSYFRAYERHAERLEITRIFILPLADFDAMRPILERHHDAGIETYALDREQIPPGRRRGIVLFDSSLLHRIVRESDDDEEVIEFTAVSDDIRRAEEYYNYLLGLAGSLDDRFVLFRAPSGRSSSSDRRER